MQRSAHGSLTYRDAGVDRDAREAMLAGLRDRIRSTFRDGVLGSGGEFGGLYHLSGYRDPVLVSSIDGVGTKTRIAAALGRWRTLGADLVAHGANDVLCHGARPLLMLDYVAASSLDPRATSDVVAGIADACRAQDIVLIGGETAEMPGVYARAQVDVVGCTIGVVERDALITGRAIRPGDRLVGLASTGLHTNGYSLARAVLLGDRGRAGQDALRRALARVPRELGEPLGDALLRAHRSYAGPVLALREQIEVHGIAHITGGGIPGNLIRILPEGCRARLDRRRWPVPPIFTLIQRRGRITDDEMLRTFNMGIGLVLVVPAGQAEAAVALLEGAGECAWAVGEVTAGARGVEIRG